MLSLDVVIAEDGAGGLAFPRSVIARNLPGVELVVSDIFPDRAALIHVVDTVLAQQNDEWTEPPAHRPRPPATTPAQWTKRKRAANVHTSLSVSR
ncbi:hypothetical protein E4K10_46650 [Streptomyces sp. T1317-0309]|nr:hypothetical protein E4K10_46650 [Streptomyces sp. T1317-0309]